MKYGSQPQQNQQRTPWGSILLISAFTVLALIMLGFIFIAIIAPPIVDRIGEKYTAEEPIELPILEISQAEIEQIDDRVDDFVEAVKNDQLTDTLILTGEEINALIQQDLDENSDDGVLFITIENGIVQGHLSIQLKDEHTFGPFRRLNGRYFTGVATFDVALDNGSLSLTVTSFEVAGEQMPQWVINALEGDQLGEKLTSDPDLAPFFEKLETVEVVADHLVLTPARPPSQ